MKQEFPPVTDRHRIATDELNPPPRLLLGPGPSNAHPRVLRALATPQVGHLDPHFLALMADIQELLRYAWQTDNDMTIPVSGTGSAAMEATVANLLEPGDRIVIGINGYFGTRLQAMAQRYGAEVVVLQKKWGEIFTAAELRAALEKHRPAVLALVHAETSTGACQPLAEAGALCREFDCLLLADTVTSLGGVPLFLDDWQVDAAYSGSQKCLSCPPGIAPLTFGPRAVEKITRRKTTVANWYLDMSLVGKYWGAERTYHHTAPISMNYALREALRLVAEEGLQQRWQRHAENSRLLQQGLQDMGLTCHVEEQYRLPVLVTVRVPDGVEAKSVTSRLLQEYNIEIGNGLGELAGKVWRIGLMGHNSRRENVVLLLQALREIVGSR